MSRDKDVTGIIEGAELCALLPHRGKMFLLSRVRTYDKKKHTLSAEYDIGPDCLFYDPKFGGIPSWVGIECMAQSISALSGIINRDEGKKPSPGFILSISQLELAVPFLSSGTVLRTCIREDYRLDAVFSYACEMSGHDPSGSYPAGKANITVMAAAGDISRWESV
ncbi:MAG: 3-hydroxylacyl-ACP dehydratase [Spirochaetaceae bacterium]|jgi:predicted hotdog family 3-hydroxylacyl-ACP dehydratase|nr:3-hydroxylacyl-ACP dehydratase [Spirochaetaceae bacterium]